MYTSNKIWSILLGPYLFILNYFMLSLPNTCYNDAKWQTQGATIVISFSILQIVYAIKRLLTQIMYVLLVLDIWG